MTLQSTDLFAVHRSGTTYQAEASVVKSGILNSHIIQSPTPPTVATHPGMTDDTIWVNTSETPPTVNVWDPAGNGGAGEWIELSGGARPINPAPGATSATPAFVSGTGTQGDPFIITPSTVSSPGGTVQSAQTITFSGLKDGALVVWTDNSVGAGTRFTQPSGVVSGTSWSGKLSYTDTPNSTSNQVYTGDLKIGTVYFRWVVTQNAATINQPSITSPAANATDLGETPTFTSSAFAITGSGITHSSSDWQVTLQTDTGFASPVVQSMTDTTNLVSWKGGPLQPGTDYIVRVRHNGGGMSSAWSNVVAFKTKNSFIRAAAPSDIWEVATDATVTIKYTAPTKFINASGIYTPKFTNLERVIGVGVDGFLYSSANGTPAMTKRSVTPPPGATSAVAVSGNYTGDQVIVLWDNGDIVRLNVLNWTHGGPIATNVKEIGNFGVISYAWYAIHDDGSVVAFESAGPSTLSVALPAGESLVQFAAIKGGTGIANATGWLVLSDTKTLYHFETALTAPNRTVVDTNVTAMSGVGGGGGPNGGVYRKDDGTVYEVTNAGVATQYDTGCLAVMKPYGYTPITIKTDGSVEVGKVKVNDAGIHGLTDFGQLPTCNASAASQAIIFTGN